MLKKIFLLLTILGLTFISTKIYFHKGFPYTHDGENHLARFANYWVAIKEGQFPPRFAPNLMNHYGYPVFNYNYPLANILSLPFSAVDVHPETTFKTLVISFVFFGLIGMYTYLEKIKKGTVTSLLATGIFATFPYLTNAIAFRGNIGEIMAVMLMPWTLWSIEVLRTQKFSNNKNDTIINRFQTIFLFFFIVGIYTTFFLSHNILSIFALPLLLLYTIWRLKKLWKVWFRFGCITLLSFFFTSWFWIPAILEKDLTVIGEVALSKIEYLQHFPSLNQLLWSPLRFGFSKTGPIDTLSFWLGLPQIAIVLISLIMIAKYSFDLFTKKVKILKNTTIWKKILFHPFFIFSFMSLFLIILQLSCTKPLWKIFSFTRFIQFPWRLQAYLMVTLAVVAKYASSLLSTKVRLFLVFTLVIQILIVYNIQAVDYFHKQPIDYDLFAQSTSTLNENRTKTFTYTDIGDWQPQPTIASGSGQIQVHHWDGTKRNYTLILDKRSKIIEPTMYFAGWETYKEYQEKKEKVNYIFDDTTQGRIAYYVDPGEYTIQTRFTQNTLARFVGNLLTITGACISLIIVIKILRKSCYIVS